MRSETLSYIESRIDAVKRAEISLHRNTGLRAESLLKSSLACLAEYDYEKVTVPLIAKRIGVTHSLIYYYFKNKDALYQAAVLHSVHILISRYRSLLTENKSPVAMMEAYIDLNVEMSDTLRSLVRIIFLNADRSKLNGPKFMDPFIEDFYDIERRILTDCIQQGIAKGIFTCSDSTDFANFISRDIDGIFYGTFMPHGDPAPVAVRYLKKVIFKVLCGTNF